MLPVNVSDLHEILFRDFPETPHFFHTRIFLLRNRILPMENKTLKEQLRQSQIAIYANDVISKNVSQILSLRGKAL